MKCWKFLMAVALAFCASPALADLAYVHGQTTVQGSDPIRVIDLATMREITTIPVAQSPSALLLTPDQRTLFVAHRDGLRVSAIDTASRAAVASIPVPFNPTQLVASADGTRVFALLNEEGVPPNERRGIFPPRIAVIDAAAKTLLRVLVVEGVADSFAVSPDGARLYAAGLGGLQVLDTTSGARLDLYPDVRMTALTMDTSGKRLYGYRQGLPPREFTLAALDLQSREVSTFGLTFPALSSPALSLSPNGDRIFASANQGAAGLIDNVFYVVELRGPRLRGPYRPRATATPLAGPLRTNAAGTRLYAMLGWIETFETDGYASLGLTHYEGLLASMAAPIDASLPGPLGGLYWNPGESGWGIHLAQRRDVVFAAWFGYDQVGAPKWYVASSCRIANLACAGCLEGVTCNGDVYEVQGAAYFGASFDPAAVRPNAIGNVSLRFEGGRAFLDARVDGVRRVVTLERQPVGSGPPPGTNYTDLWWSPSEPGWGVGITHEHSRMFLAWFVYDAMGRPAWYVVSDCAVTAGDDGCRGTVYRTVGPPQGFTFDPNAVLVFQVGTVEVRFTDSRTGQLSFTVGGVSGVKAITRQLF